MVAQTVESPAHLTDESLVRACVAGDHRAWEELVDRYGRLVYSVPRRYGLGADDADDVLQNVFLILFRRLADLRDHSRLSAWLLTIAHREARHVGKRAAASVALDGAEITIVDDGEPPPAEVERREREQLVREALGRVDDRCRRCLTALFLEPAGGGYSEIAARLGMPIGSIGPTRARCFKKLEAILIEMGVEPEV